MSSSLRTCRSLACLLVPVCSRNSRSHELICTFKYSQNKAFGTLNNGGLGRLKVLDSSGMHRHPSAIEGVNPT
jgi:hypothetical protein